MEGHTIKPIIVGRDNGHFWGISMGPKSGRQVGWLIGGIVDVAILGTITVLFIPRVLDGTALLWLPLGTFLVGVLVYTISMYMVRKS